MKKKLYKQPDTRILVEECEGLLMLSPNGFHLGGAGTYEDDEVNNNDDY